MPPCRTEEPIEKKDADCEIMLASDCEGDSQASQELLVESDVEEPERDSGCSKRQQMLSPVLGYEVIEARLSKLGYVLAADTFNEAIQARLAALRPLAKTCSERELTILACAVQELAVELGCLQGVGGEEWSHFRMGKETDAFMRGFIGNSFASPVLVAALVSILANWDMLLPESLNCESDLKQAERQRPSAEATQAQKGVGRWVALLTSLLNVSDDTFKNKPIIILNLTGYVEDVGVAVAWFVFRPGKGQPLRGGVKPENLYYQSVGWLSKEPFGHARLEREITEAWIQRKFEHGGHKYACDPPELTQAEIEGIPSATAAMGNLDKVEFEVLERINDKMMIKSDEHKFFSAQTGDIKSEYDNLREQHLDLVGRQAEHQVKAKADEDNSQSQPVPPAAAGVQLESLAKLESDIGVEIKIASEVSNVELIKAKDGSLWLLSSQSKTIGKHVLVGGYGTGQWLPSNECTEPAVPFQVPDGDKTPVQIDETTFGPEGAQGVSTLSIYKLLLRAETEKHVSQHRVSFLKVERKQAVEAGEDGFEVSVSKPMVFKACKDPRDPDKVTCKNVFNKFINQLPDALVTVVRFRFERVGQNFKVQRPYVLTSRALSLEKEKPLKLA
ncbi:Uncharacterized protein SCF082_LOCUS12453 [Durusdinium trenchii]|uniref:Uncharacterized protein n=1 Tax=Durusdinium trenchii TaxID=1381693 RepID=A0ABP0JKE5_9DINO